MRNWVHSILKMPNNPMLHHALPSFLTIDKIENLLQEMIPKKFIITVDRSYSAIVNKSNAPDPSESPPLTISMKINPILIIGGGPNKIPPPQFLISGKSHQLYSFSPDFAQNYINECYPE